MKKIIFLVFIGIIGLFLSGCGQRGKEETTSLAPEKILMEEEPSLTEEELDSSLLPSESAETTGAVSTQPVATEVSGAFVKPSTKEIQQALKNAGFYQGNIDGILGPKTKEAIRTFQSQNSLTADGKVGSKTWQKLAPYLTKQTKSAQ